MRGINEQAKDYVDYLIPFSILTTEHQRLDNLQTMEAYLDYCPRNQEVQTEESLLVGLDFF